MSQSLWRKAGKFPGRQTLWQNYWWPQEVWKEWLFAYSKARESHINIPKMCSYIRYAFVMCLLSSIRNKNHRVNSSYKIIKQVSILYLIYYVRYSVCISPLILRSYVSMWLIKWLIKTQCVWQRSQYLPLALTSSKKPIFRITAWTLHLRTGSILPFPVLSFDVMSLP